MRFHRRGGNQVAIYFKTSSLSFFIAGPKDDPCPCSIEESGADFRSIVAKSKPIVYIQSKKESSFRAGQGI